MNALDARRQQLEAELSASPTPALVRLHPGMADVYRKRVRQLVEGMGASPENLEVTEAIRSLVDRIVLTPELRLGRKRATLTVDLEGALAAILHLASGSSAKNNSNSKKPASGEETGLSQSMLKLVAGAGFGHWLQLSRASNLSARPPHLVGQIAPCRMRTNFSGCE